MQFGELVRLNPSVLTPMNKFTRLRELCCSMDNALPDSIAFLTGLTALNITWMFGANKGNSPSLACRFWQTSLSSVSFFCGGGEEGDGGGGLSHIPLTGISAPKILEHTV